MLKRIVNPRMPPTPIQYQFGSVKISKISRTANPKLVELSEDCKESKRALLDKKKKKGSHIRDMLITVAEILPVD